jgi:hypothetical protein
MFSGTEAETAEQYDASGSQFIHAIDVADMLQVTCSTTEACPEIDPQTNNRAFGRNTPSQEAQLGFHQEQHS